jgi:hypothetical protein
MHSAIEEFLKWSSKHSKESVKPHVVTTNIEHCATELPLKHWEEKGIIGEILISDNISKIICKLLSYIHLQ